MNVAKKPYRTVWRPGEGEVRINDPHRCQHAFEILALHTAEGITALYPDARP